MVLVLLLKEVCGINKNYMIYIRKLILLGNGIKNCLIMQKILEYPFFIPFDETAVDFLEELGTKAYKIASPEIVDLPLIRKVAKTLKPVIISTGMASLKEIKEAIQTVRENGNQNLIVLHCTSAYPTPIEEANLSTIKKISDEFDVLVGLSDHSMGTKVSCYACLLGSCLIEKHFTLE